MNYLTQEDATAIYFTQKNIDIAKKYYTANQSRYKERECFNNLTTFFLHDNNRRNVRYCYGVVLSGIPNRNGVAVSHGWLETSGQITDLTMLANGEKEENIENYLYFPWKKYDFDDYCKAVISDIMPDVLLRSDNSFIEKVEGLGYSYIG